MYKAIKEKFNQYKDLRNMLLGTETYIVEQANINDTFWSAGADGYGQNKLGQIIMRVRDELTKAIHVSNNNSCNNNSPKLTPQQPMMTTIKTCDHPSEERQTMVPNRTIAIQDLLEQALNANDQELVHELLMMLDREAF